MGQTSVWEGKVGRVELHARVEPERRHKLHLQARQRLPRSNVESPSGPLDDLKLRVGWR